MVPQSLAAVGTIFLYGIDLNVFRKEFGKKMN